MGTGRTGLPQNITDDHPEWVLYFCNFKKAWDLRPKTGGKCKGEGIIVMHPDTGITNHPEVMEGGRYLIDKAKNFLKPWESAADDLEGFHFDTWTPSGKYGYLLQKNITVLGTPSHGTKTASVLMSKEGRPNMDDFPNYHLDAQFVTGVAPLVKAIPLKVTKSVILDATTFPNLTTSVNYAVSLSKSSSVLDNDDSQIGVISISLGGLSLAASQSMKAALVEARKAGIVVVASAGQGKGILTAKLLQMAGGAFPANDPDNTISVAGCDSMHNRYVLGYYGPNVDITAPGIKIWRAVSEKRSGQLDHHHVHHGDGTSYSAAIVAGACALWQAHHGRANLLNDYGPELIFDLFKKVLQDSCHTPHDWETDRRGAGVIDAENLLLCQLPPKSEIERIRGT